MGELNPDKLNAQVFRMNNSGTYSDSFGKTKIIAQNIEFTGDAKFHVPAKMATIFIR